MDTNDLSLLALPQPLSSLSPLAIAILKTLAYYDLFEYPLRPAEIHENLIGLEAVLQDVQVELHASAMRPLVDHRKGFYFLRDGENRVVRRLCCEQSSEQIFNKNLKLLRFICGLPFVQVATLSGAMAFKNCKANDDIDLFLIVDGRRIWSVYLFLVLALKLLGKRELICINYLRGSRNMTIPEQNFFVAHQIANLRLLSGNGQYENFVVANNWIKDYFPQLRQEYDNEFNRTLGDIESGSKRKQRLERFFGHAMFDRVENWIYRVYSKRIKQRTSHTNGSVQVDKETIRLFTNDHKTTILERYQERLLKLFEGSNAN